MGNFMRPAAAGLSCLFRRLRAEMRQEASEPYPISVPVLRKQERGLRGAVKYVRGAFDRFSLSSLQ